MPLSDAATIALARELYPDVTTVAASDAFLTAWLPWARGLVGLGSWLTQYDTGVAMLLAHQGQRRGTASGGGGGASGPIQSISTLGMSVSYGSTAGGTSSLDLVLSSTRAGSDWLSLRGSLPDYILPIVVPFGGGW